MPKQAIAYKEDPPFAPTFVPEKYEGTWVYFKKEFPNAEDNDLAALLTATALKQNGVRLKGVRPKEMSEDLLSTLLRPTFDTVRKRVLLARFPTVMRIDKHEVNALVDGNTVTVQGSLVMTPLRTTFEKAVGDLKLCRAVRFPRPLAFNPRHRKSQLRAASLERTTVGNWYPLSVDKKSVSFYARRYLNSLIYRYVFHVDRNLLTFGEKHLVEVWKNLGSVLR